VTATVTGLALAPVKGMRVARMDAVRLEERGPVGDRAFLVLDGDGKLLQTSRTPALLAVEPAWDGTTLRLRFADGSEVAEEPRPGEVTVTRLYDGREMPGRLVDGAPAAALSEHLGRSVRLLMRDDQQTGADDFPVSLMSEESLAALAPALGGDVPDARRFRMTVTIAGVEPWEEHGWAGREVAAGEAVLRVVDPIPRCVVTTRDPDRGSTDAPILKALARLRGKDDVTFGVWCEVARPGDVRLGDSVTPA
jgi:MOSC domain-containing protein